MGDAIVASQLRKTFGRTVAVEGLDLAIPEGALYGFIGPNGAGKTTTIRMIMAILFPDAGELRVLGHASAMEAKDRIGYLPEERGVYRKMKVGAFLKYMGRLKGVDESALDRLAKQWLERVGLAEVWKKKCEELSKGMQQKVQFVASVLHEPDLLILDEPFSGLDPVNQRLMRELFLEQHQRGATVIFSTHVMHQAEQLCDHLVMINNGRKVLDSTLGQIRSDYDPNTLVFEPLDASTNPSALEQLPGVRTLQRGDHGLELRLDEGVDASSLMRAAMDKVPMARLEIRRPTLEDVFIQIVTGAEEQDMDESELRAALRDPTASTGSTA